MEKKYIPVYVTKFKIKNTFMSVKHLNLLFKLLPSVKMDISSSHPTHPNLSEQ